MACATKLYSNSHLDELLVEFENNARANGAHVYWAKDADEYCNIVYNILNQHGVKHFIKSKSMLAEECELNPFLESKGIEVVESDLGERILQLMHLKPSHIVLPAIHIKREQVGELSERWVRRKEILTLLTLHMQPGKIFVRNLFMLRRL